MKALLLPLAATLLCHVLSGQSALRAPVTGFVLDSQIQAIRPILGIPGSAVFGEPLDLPFPVSAVAVSESGAFALAFGPGDSGGLLLVRGLRDESPRAAPTEGAIAGIELMAISADGSTAVLLSRSARCIQFLTGLPDRPSLQAPTSLDALPGRIRSLAISANGRQAAITSTLDDSGAVALIDQLPGAAPRTIATPRRPIAVLFANQDRDLIYLDSREPRLVLLRDPDGGRDEEVLLSAENGLQSPTACASSGSTLWLTDIRTQDSVSIGHLIVFDLGSARVTSERALTALPDRFQTLGRAGVFALNALDSGPVYLLSSTDSSVVFVPSIVR